MKKRVLAAILGSLSLSAGVTTADPRPWTFVTDTYAVGKGGWEYEQWVTWQTHKDSDSGYDRFQFRHEFEFGLADNFDLGVYVTNWSYEDSEEVDGDAEWDSAGLDGIIYLTNPVTDFVGIGLYAEALIGEDEIEFENKLLLHKDIDKWSLAYNLVFETEIEHEDEEDEDEVEGELKNVFGVSYALSPSFRLGGELIIESAYEHWHHYEGTTVYAGPNFHYHGGELFKGANWWVTVTPVFQLTDEEDEPDVQVRMIAALEF